MACLGKSVLPERERDRLAVVGDPLEKERQEPAAVGDGQAGPHPVEGGERGLHRLGVHLRGAGERLRDSAQVNDAGARVPTLVNGRGRGNGWIGCS